MNSIVLTTIVSIPALESVMAKALIRHGASEFAAMEVAKALRRAEQLGNTHCGLRHLILDCAQLNSGRVAGAAEPKIRRTKLGLINVDANNGFAQPAFALGLQDALHSAEKLGVAVLAIRRAYTCAALGYFPEIIAERGFIGVACTNASASVTAPGGSRPLLGTNPVAMSVPDGKGGIAFQFDQCTSAANLRHIREAARSSAPIPQGWAVSSGGTPTTNALEALEGALLPASGGRGFGFGLMAEVLASFFTDSAMSLDTPSLSATEGPPHGLGIFCLLIHPTAIAGATFWNKLDKLTNAVHKQPGTRLPGTGRVSRGEMVVDSALWQQAQTLADAQ